jgi:hypothetical protein
MSLKYAKSMSLECILTEYCEVITGPTSLDCIISPNLTAPEGSWLNDIRATLGNAANLKILRTYIGCPYLKSHHCEPIEKADWPFPPAPSMFSQPLRQLIHACKSLKTLEVELFHHFEIHAAKVIPTTTAETNKAVDTEKRPTLIVKLSVRLPAEEGV